MGLEDGKIVIATHYLVYGIPQALREYLIDHRIRELLYIAHPLNAAAQGGSYFEKISKGTICEKKSINERKSHGIIDYFREIVWNIQTVARRKERYDLFIGIDNLNACAGIILRKLNLVKKVAYWTLDYAPVRFENPLLNFIYHALDKFCVAHADETWNVSPRMAEGRETIRGMARTKYPRQKVVPAGIWFDRVKRLPFENIQKHQLVFVGDLLKKQGVQHVLDALPIILREIGDFHFLIIGGGEYEETLRSKARDLGIESHVTFTGWVRDRKDLDNLIASGALGIAMYEKYDEKGNLTFTNFADPGKFKDYLSAGLPVLLTDVPYNAKEIEEKKCGKIIKPDKAEIARAVIEILKDEESLKKYRENALEYIKQYDWKLIFDKGLSGGII